MKKQITAAITVAALLVTFLLNGCGTPKEAKNSQGANGSKAEKLVIAYQWGLAYAPLEVMKQQNLIEKHYDGDLEVEWRVMNGSSEMYGGLVSGTIDVAHSGVAPFLINTSKGVPCKMYSAMAAQPMGLNTTRDDLQSLSDFKPDDKIALVSWGSIQHIMLSMAAEQVLGDAHALDNNIVNMSHPDGMQALLSGTVPAQLTTSPFFFKELESGNVHEIKEVADAFPEDTSIIIGAASTKLYEERKEVYDALTAAVEEAMTFLNENTEEAATLLCEKEAVTPEKMKEYLTSEGSSYDRVPKGVLEIGAFMERAGFMEKAPSSYAEICFPELSERIKE